MNSSEILLYTSEILVLTTLHRGLQIVLSKTIGIGDTKHHI
jgi:hypothetical protein